METNQKVSFWRRKDSRRVGHMLLIGLALGVTVHWLNLSAPPLSVSAREDEPAMTNAPAAFKTEGASPSVPR